MSDAITLPCLSIWQPWAQLIGLVHAVGCASPNATDSLPPKFSRWAMRDRYTWLFAEAAPLKEPLPVRGKQGIFQVEIPTNLIPEGVQIHV